jgi:hypothetical protein
VKHRLDRAGPSVDAEPLADPRQHAFGEAQQLLGSDLQCAVRRERGREPDDAAVLEVPDSRTEVVEELR